MLVRAGGAQTCQVDSTSPCLRRAANPHPLLHLCLILHLLACSLAVEAAADTVPGIEQYAMRAFADALDIVPLSLAENSGLPPIESLTEVCGWVWVGCGAGVCRGCRGGGRCGVEAPLDCSARPHTSISCV